ncbi:hypothetical protein A3D03_03350 [Candidatus Gottesmanbacteria bacterium RIFCSPHIGHO2_02_FULL_40_13]|uniref:GHMP kinase N-terminal domain-containing protein n=1 Tax=Candidatus Gottesmanbacteria bacterium RIFCSPHIGHO2_02_FULL_40_13 TaxID=1798384 RepID=A0A1F6A653_9BACT|nr:MAG: hypothetical protein A3D03_03350 [Candidatus Gottesmanbacteria bacterium RIFCSPHIGHO2_02_FULL_40_13]
MTQTISAKAYCPVSLSLIFKVCPNPNPYKMGSQGVGFTVNKIVTVEAAKSENTIVFFNNKRIKLPTLTYLINLLTHENLCIQIHSPLPLGCGFGISGASALACSLAVNKLLNLGKSKLFLTKLAHLSEIIHGTGLGSVGTESTGGFLLKETAGIPFRYKAYPYVGQKVYAVILGKIETPTILQNKNLGDKINIAADLVLNKIKKINKITLPDFLDCSLEFANRSGLLTDQKLINFTDTLKTDNFHVTMAMLGRVLITDKNPSSVVKNYPVVKLIISDQTAGLLD